VREHAHATVRAEPELAEGPAQLHLVFAFGQIQLSL
jgi:hypothetical protein